MKTYRVILTGKVPPRCDNVVSTNEFGVEQKCNHLQLPWEVGLGANDPAIGYEICVQCQQKANWQDHPHPTKGVVKVGTPTEGHVTVQAESKDQAVAIARRLNPEYDDFKEVKEIKT